MKDGLIAKPWRMRAHTSPRLRWDLLLPSDSAVGKFEPRSGVVRLANCQDKATAGDRRWTAFLRVSGI